MRSSTSSSWIGRALIAVGVLTLGFCILVFLDAHPFRDCENWVLERFSLDRLPLAPTKPASPTAGSKNRTPARKTAGRLSSGRSLDVNVKTSFS